MVAKKTKKKSSSLPLGCLENIITNYFNKRPDPKLLKEHLDTQMAAFEEAEAKRLAKNTETQEDGFIVATGSSKKRLLPTKGAKVVKQQKNYELNDFYRFQIKKAKYGDQESLKQKFQKDLQMISILKTNKIL